MTTTRLRREDLKPEAAAAAVYLTEDLVTGSLGEDADEHVLRDILGADVDQELINFAAGAGGNSRLLAELVLGLEEEGLIREDNGTVQLIARRVPYRILTFVMERLGDLSTNCQQFLKVAAAFGSYFMLEDVSRMLDRSSAALLSALDEAMASGFVVSAEHRFAFQSDFLLRGIIESIPAPARDAVRREAMSLSGRRAPAYDQTPYVTERPMEPYGALNEGAGGSCSPAHSLIINGDAAAGVRVAERVLATPGVSPSARRDAEASLMLGHFLLGKCEAEKISATILRERGTASGDIATSMALTTQSNLLWRAGELSEALKLGRTAVRHSEDADPVWRLHFQHALAGKLANLREFDKAESLIIDVEAGLRGLPTPVWTAAPAVTRSRLFLQAGRIGEARREAELATAAVRGEAVPMLRPLAYSVLSTASFYMGNLPEASDYLARAQNDLASYAVLYSVQYAWIEILITVKRDGPRAAARLLSEKYSHLPTQRSLYIEVPSAAAFLVVLARDVGDSDLARSVLETVDGLAAANPGIPVVGLTAVHANALANSAPAALALIIVQSPDPISVALATEQLAKLYSGKSLGAGRQLASPHTHDPAFHSHDPAFHHSHDADSGHPHEAASGHPHEPDGDHDGCWSKLSDMERRISYLVSVGMTNRQIGRQVHLSAHTINYHLRKLYKKLSINTRVELAHGAATYLRRAAVYSMDDEED